MGFFYCICLHVTLSVSCTLVCTSCFHGTKYHEKEDDMATLIKRPNRNNWYVEFELNGKLKRVSTGVSLDGRKEGCSPRHAREIAQIQANRLEAVAKGNVSAQKMIAQIRAVSASGNIPTVREFLQQAIERRKKLNAEKTLGNDVAAIRRFLDWLGAQADAPLDSVNKAVALSFAEDQLQRVRQVRLSVTGRRWPRASSAGSRRNISPLIRSSTKRRGFSRRRRLWNGKRSRWMSCF